VRQQIPFQLERHSLPDECQALVEAFIHRGDTSVPAQGALVVALSALSLEQGGGPFGAAVFDSDGALVSVGINRVVPWKSYEFHAEGVALALAKRRVTEDFLLPADWTLVTSSAPCCMCFGRIYWSGLRGLLVCARREDVESLTGFDEGPLPAQWQQALVTRGFTVREDVARDEARSVLARYEGPLYQRPAR
jgi:tRNA(Arg) A34 adenosine deaminase TadA